MNKSAIVQAWRPALVGLLLPAVSFCAAADSTLSFDVDFARFMLNDSIAIVEFHFAVPRTNLKFVEEGSSWRAGFACEVSIATGDSVLIKHGWSAENLARSQDEIHPGQLLFTQAQFQVPAGEYQVSVHVEDANSKNFGRKSGALSVPPLAPHTLSMSDLQFASLISRDSTASLYQKNNYKVVPNPAALYGTGMPIVYTYCEIYGLSFPSDSTYEVSYRVLNGAGREMKAPPAKRRRIAGRSLVEVNALNIATLSSGTYHFEVRVLDHHSGKEVVQDQKFFVYREQDVAAAESEAVPMSALAEYYRRLSESELDEEFAPARYIAQDEEKKIFGSLNEDGKRDFLVRFWSRRDETPETARNEVRDDFLARVDFANKNFSGLRQGWKTDLGRVLLVYGQPSEIERVPNSGDSRAYQIWKYYELEGGVEFVFVDLKGWGSYDLVNSTARAELHDPDWERWLSPQ